MRSESGHAVAAALARRHGSGFWTVAFAFLIVMAFATLPSPLYGLYRARDHLSAFTVTVVYAIFAAGTIAALLRVRSIAERVGRRGVMLGSVATMMTGAALLAAWKTLPVLLVGRLLTGVAVGLAAGTAITYLIELRVRRDPNASLARARNIGTSVNVGALGVGPLVAGCLAQLSMAIGFSPLAATKFPTGGHRFSPLVAIRSPHWWPSNLPSRGAVEC